MHGLHILMAQNGDIVFFRCEPVESYLDVVPRIADAVESRGVSYVTTELTPNRAWEAFQLRLRGRYSKADKIDPQQFEFASRGMPLEDLPLHIGGPHGQSIALYASAVGMRIVRAVQRDVPKEILGNFEPSDASIRTGEHDIFDYLGGPIVRGDYSGEFFGRATLSVSFFGYGFPGNWRRCRELILKVPEVQECRRVLEEIVGPMQQTVVWSA